VTQRVRVHDDHLQVKMLPPYRNWNARKPHLPQLRCGLGERSSTNIAMTQVGLFDGIICFALPRPSLVISASCSPSSFYSSSSLGMCTPHPSSPGNWPAVAIPHGLCQTSTVWSRSAIAIQTRIGSSISASTTAPPHQLLSFQRASARAGGGRTWPRYVIQYTGAEVGGKWKPSMTLYDYAVSGAVCSNLITPRYMCKGIRNS
jgi:hypothetical protein